MKRPINGKLVASSATVPIVGMLADAPNGVQVGHAVADDLTPIIKAIGNGEIVSLHQEPHAPVAVEVTVVELMNHTLRFRIHG